MIKTINELNKNLKKDRTNLKQYNISVLGDSATQFLSKAILGYGFEYGYNIQIFDADYNQIRAQITDKNSEMYKNNPNMIVLYMCYEKLYERYCDTKINERINFADEVYNEIKFYWDTINKNINTNIIQFLLIEDDDRAFGNFGLNVENSFIYQVKKLNNLIYVNKYKNIYLLDLNRLKMQLGKEFKDEKNYFIAKMPISLKAIPYVAKEIIDIVNALSGKIKKCIVLDLDNTLWGGVIGDDGMEGIEIGDLGNGHAFSDFQSWLKQLKNRGIILAICSKNNENTAKEPFMKHPDMVLRLEDIAIFVANWNDKATNIRYIQKVLNIGMDSIVFIDDNPFERNLVKSQIEEITAPDLPEDPSEYVTYLKELNLFETASYSEEDVNRTSQYQAEVNRQELENEFESYDDYLENLEMIAEVKPFDSFHFPRIAQLTQRSNQFNLRTIRYTEDEIKKISEDKNKITIYFTLKDKFGDHGLISVVILKKEKNYLFIDEWLMSCRVLKRGMEEFIINKIVDVAKENGYNKIIGEYIQTKKNSMVEHIYENHGLKSLGNNLYECDVDNYQNSKTFIKESD